jgi:uncharacterized iron-regulated membrane protein
MSELLSPESGATLLGAPDANGAGSRPAWARARRPHGPVNHWWIRLHRWSSLVLGLLLLLEATTGAVLLYGNDIARLAYPQRYAVTPSQTPLPPAEALALVRAAHPELRPVGVQSFEGVYLVRGDGNGRDQTDAFVDPGTGQINAVARELPDPILLLINIHDCALTCAGLPGYQAWLSTPLPGLFGHNVTLGGYLLGLLGTLLIFLAVSGAIVWWPGLHAWATGFVVRRGRGGYVRDLDLHRVVGIVAVPFLLMWGVTGAAFYFRWPAQVYSALLPGQIVQEPPSPPPGTGPMLNLEQAQDAALRAHPGARMTGFILNDPDTPGGSYGFRMYQGSDPYRYWNYAGSIYVQVDSHGGGLRDYAPENPGTPLAQRLWQDGFYYGLHFGSSVGSGIRLIWLLFGLTPVVLAVTGLTVWLTKSRSKRNRRRRRTSRGEPATGA